MLIDRNLLSKIAQRCMETGTLFVIDECFLSFTDELGLQSLMNHTPNLIILKAFTKMYAMAGLRLGYILSGNCDVLKAAEEQAPCWSVSSVAQTAGLAALQCEKWEEKTRQLVLEERNYLSHALKSLGFTVFDSQSNFLLMKSTQPLYEKLLQRGILIRSCGNYVGLDARFYRLAVKSHSQNKTLIQAIMEVLHGESNHDTGHHV